MQKPPTTVLPSHVPAPGASGPNGGPPTPKPKVKKLRVGLVLAGLMVLAGVSTVFGMMMAVASDLPALENRAEFKRAQNSKVYADAKGDTPLATLTGNQNRILLNQGDISVNIKNAVIAIEDRRFYEHEGVDYRGIGRALFQDIRQQSAAQGGSTITQQFVKNALTAQANRTVFQKLREAALAYHLERKWTKQKVLTQYLNSVYFGNGAYGIEAAVRTYFRGDTDEDQAATMPTGLDPTEEEPENENRREAKEVSPSEAALLAGMIASPTRYDPIENPIRAKRRRNQVLERMLDESMISKGEYDDAITDSLPSENEVDPPQPDSDQPYFTSWLTQQLVDKYRASAVFSGGLKVRTTLDPELQASAEQAINGRLAGVGPSASLVAIENKTGEVKAMVGGTDFEQKPFNLATNGHRQPGSSFKPFILIRALEDGVSPEATFESRRKVFPVPGSKTEKFPVNNYEDSYSGIASLRSATLRSDNSVYAELGLKVGTKRVAALAQRMGIKTRVSDNPAMTLGGLKEGLTPLELAYAYSTIANRGVKVSGSLAASEGGPVAIQKVERGDEEVAENERERTRVFPANVADTAQQMLAGVVMVGTGKAAQIGEFAAGKTGTTENYGDAWFVGFNKELTVAVWVGYPDKLQYMKTEYHGGEVAGGTFPTEIWHDFMRSWIGIRERRDEESGKKDDEDAETTPSVPTGPSLPQGQGAPAEPEGGQEAPKEPKQRKPSTPPQTPKPSPTPAPAPTPTPAPVPGGGEGGGGLSGLAPPHRRRPRPRHAAAGGIAEAPRQVDRHADPDPLPGHDLGRRPGRAAAPRSDRRAECR